MSDFEKVLDEYKEQTKPMCEALDCIDLLDDFLVDIELSRAKYHHFYQAGAQSQQAKIDELQGRIDEITNHVDINFDEGRDDDQHSYWSGYNQAMRELNDILKGNKDEN